MQQYKNGDCIWVGFRDVAAVAFVVSAIAKHDTGAWRMHIAAHAAFSIFSIEHLS